MPRRAGQLGPTVTVFGQSEALHSEVHESGVHGGESTPRPEGRY